MISKNTLDLLKKDIVKILIIQILNNLILSQLTGEQLFNNKWKNNLVGTLIGFLVYNLVTKKYTQAFKDLIQSTNPNVNNALSDILKFGTILVVKHIYVLGRIQFRLAAVISSYHSKRRTVGENPVRNCLPALLCAPRENLRSLQRKLC